MTNKEFLNKSLSLVKEYIELGAEKDNYAPLKELDEDAIFVVYSCKINLYSKALICTRYTDEVYFEVNYYADDDEIYLNVYEKTENQSIKL